MSCISNPFSEQQNESFEEFLSRANKSNTATNNQMSVLGMTDSEMKKQVDKANKILDGFIPPMKGG